MGNYNKLNKNCFSILNFAIDVFIFAYVLSVFLFSFNVQSTYISRLFFIPCIIFLFIYFIKGKSVQINYCWICFGVFILICLISCYGAYEIETAIKICITLVELFIFVFLLINYAVRENKIKLLIFSLVVSGIIFSCYIILYYGIVECFEKMLSGERIGEELMNVNTVGIVSSYTFVLLFWFILYEKKYYCIVPAIICFITAFGSGSKKAFLIILLGVMLLFLFRGKIKKRLLNILEFIIVLCVLYFVIKQPMFNAIRVRLVQMINGLTGKSKTDISTRERLNFIKYGFDSFAESPFWGVGVGNTFLITLKASGWRTYLHNNYIELLASVGLVGTIVYYLMLVIPLVVLLRSLIEEKDKITVLGVCFIIIKLIVDFALVSYYDKTTYLYFILFEIISKKVGEKK